MGAVLNVVRRPELLGCDEVLHVEQGLERFEDKWLVSLGLEARKRPSLYPKLVRAAAPAAAFADARSLWLGSCCVPVRVLRCRRKPASERWYEQGYGVQKDLARAVHWYKLAAAQGLSEAQYHLDILAERGRGVPRDFAEATKWYTRAADQGYAPAQSRLGSCYAAGIGVDKDQVKAYFWLTLASKQHDQDAEKQRAELAPELSPNEIGKTEPSAAERKPKPAPVQNPAAVH
jgi:hypothetical protein